jgi:peroxiredoxin Q/BCP
MNKPNPLQPGSPAPIFSTTDQDGKTHSNQTLLGTRYLIYFYPRDLTPGCTTEACALRDEYEQFAKLNTLVFGISPDGEKSHLKFIDKHRLPFSLLVDEDHAIAEAFGVWGEKKFMGRTFDGVHRMSFLIAIDGKIEKTYAKVKPAEHAQQVLADLQG